MSVGLRLFITSQLKDGVSAATFEDAGRRMSAMVADREPDTTVYNWWMGEDGTVVSEDGFTDEEAFGTHMANMAELGFLDEWMSLVDVKSVQALGTVGDATREALAGFGAVHYGRIAF